MGKNIHVYMSCVIIYQSEELQVIRNCWLKVTCFLIKSHFSLYWQISTGLSEFSLLALGLTGDEHGQLVSRAIPSLV